MKVGTGMVIKTIVCFFIGASLLLLLCGCAINIPWFYRADKKPVYVSKYFSVKSPKGFGWQVRERQPSLLLKEAGVDYETDLFDEFIPPRICLYRYTIADLWPHPPGRSCFIEFYSVLTDPERFHYDARLIAEAENRKDRAPAWLDTLFDLGLKRTAEVTIGDRKYYEFLSAVGGSGKQKRYRLQYVRCSEDPQRIYIINVQSDKKNLPEKASRIVEGFQPHEEGLSHTELAMERGAQNLYDVTLNRLGRLPHVNDLARAADDFLSVIEVEPLNQKAHLFLGAVYLLMQKVEFPVDNFDCLRVTQGLWDYYCFTSDGQVFHSLLHGEPPDEKMVKAFQRAVQLDPHSFWANYYLTWLYLRQKDYGKAKALGQNFAQHYPESALVWYTLGLTLKESGNFEMASEAFTSALRKNKGDFVKFWHGTLKGKNIVEWQIESLGEKE